MFVNSKVYVVNLLCWILISNVSGKALLNLELLDKAYLNTSELTPAQLAAIEDLKKVTIFLEDASITATSETANIVFSLRIENPSDSTLAVFDPAHFFTSTFEDVQGNVFEVPSGAITEQGAIRGGAVPYGFSVVGFQGRPRSKKVIQKLAPNDSMRVKIKVFGISKRGTFGKNMRPISNGLYKVKVGTVLMLSETPIPFRSVWSDSFELNIK